LLGFVSVRWRFFISMAVLVLTGRLAVAAKTVGPFDFRHVVEMAEEIAKEPQRPPQRVGDAFLELDYDGYRKIHTRHDTALWRGTDAPFWAEFFIAGMIFEWPVRVHVVDEKGDVENLKADDRWFQFRGDAAPLAKVVGSGFSGLRLFSDEPNEPYKTEFTVFQGASYFRARGYNQVYGSSARGLAIDIGLATPEEFPRFYDIWLKRPAAGAKSTVVWALMDSPALSGAYQFTITPGQTAAIDVEAQLWFRHGVQTVGVAPLTSMWMWDDHDPAGPDPRPEVHDSDGLLIHHDADAWTWRPLRRPDAPRVTKWNVNELQGFGLLQRDRDFARYNDSEAKYDRRPSLWVTPAESWGSGRIELLELPSNHEGGDNIGAYWVSSEPISGPTHRVLKYRVEFGGEPAEPKPLWIVRDTRVRPAGEPTAGDATVEVEFAVDPSVAAGETLTPQVTADSGAVTDVALDSQETGRLVLRFRFQPPADGRARLEAYLTNNLNDSDSRPVSETWSFTWTR
jgi:glucans biosynthesis protein